MEHSKRARQRCTECRKWFTPSVRALETQRVCSCKACREARDRRLARERRGRDLDQYRDEERERQRKCRRARREAAGGAGPSVAKCHAPPSAPNVSKLQRKILQNWDKAAELSRATFAQKLEEFLDENEEVSAEVGTERARKWPLSRATFGL
jgi:hypothetical protein